MKIKIIRENMREKKYSKNKKNEFLIVNKKKLLFLNEKNSIFLILHTNLNRE